MLREEHAALLEAFDSLKQLTARQHAEIHELSQAQKRSQQKLAEASQLCELRSIECMQLQQQLEHSQAMITVERAATDGVRSKQSSLIVRTLLTRTQSANVLEDSTSGLSVSHRVLHLPFCSRRSATQPRTQLQNSPRQ